VPIYEYECPSCGTFERMQKFSDPVLSRCPTCDEPVEKLLSPPAIQFKGTGWYVTDYAGKGSGKDGGSDDKAKASKGDKEGGAKKEPATSKDSSSTSSKATKGSS